MGGGVRTHDHWNHNPALYQLSYTHRDEGPSNFTRGFEGAQIKGKTWFGVAVIPYSPALFHNSSTRRFTSAGISITPGHGLVNPSPGHLRVASTPIFEP